MPLCDLIYESSLFHGGQRCIDAAHIRVQIQVQLVPDTIEMNLDLSPSAKLVLASVRQGVA